MPRREKAHSRFVPKTVLIVATPTWHQEPIIDGNNMPMLSIRLVATHEETGKEYVLAKLESDQYDQEHLDALVNGCLSQALEEIKAESLQVLRSWRPEVSVVLTTYAEESVRPSLHLSQSTLLRLSEAGAEFDFDPYV